MPKLYELENTFLQVQSMIEDDDELLSDTLESIDFFHDFENKLVGYGKVNLNVLADINELKKEEERLKTRRKELENKLAFLQGKMLDAMNMVGCKKITNPVVTIKRRNNKRVSILNEEALNDKYLVPQKPKVSKSKIREALKNGEAVEGAEMTTYTSLNIK